MSRLSRVFAVLAAATALSMVPNPPAATADDLAVHLQLDRSAPAADTTVETPSEIRLWFSQVPQASATSMRLIRNGAPVDGVGALQPDDGDASIFAAPVEEPLEEGAYTVSWRTMAADGHVVRGDFSFTVRAP
jgi:methionine-rich copper-binding protein CopC